MSVRNILDQLTNDSSVKDTKSDSQTVNWIGAGAATNTVTFVKTNNLFIIVLSPFTATTAASNEFIGQVFFPIWAIPTDSQMRQTLNVVNNNGNVVGCVYFNNINNIHISGSSSMGSAFQNGATNAGIPNGAIIIYSLVQ